MKHTKLQVLLVLLVTITLLVPTMSFASDGEVATLSIMINDNGRTWVPDTPNNKAILDILGVNLDAVVAEEETITLSFASGDLPDIVVFPQLTYTEYVNTGYLLPLNDLLDEYGQQIVELTTDFATNLCSIGDTIYTFPYENNNAKYYTYIRKDWLDNVGFNIEDNEQVPGSDIYYLSLEEYTEILQAFTYDDPDGNGEDDTFGLSTYTKNDGDISFMALFGAFGGVMTQNYEKDGVIWPFETTDEYRAVLEYISDLWDQGLIDPEIFIYETDQAKTNMMNGKSGTFVGWWSSAYEFIRDGMKDLDPDVEWCTAEIVGLNGEVGMKDNGRITSTVCITTACEDPELAMQVLNTLNGEECWWLIRYGVEGEHYNLDAEGYPTRTEAGTELFQSMTMDTLYPLANRIVIENFANSAPQTDEKLQIRRQMLIHQFVEGLPLYSDFFYGLSQTQEDMDYSVDVDAIVVKYCMQFITGEVELTDANWAAYLDKWVNMGGDLILESFVDAYNALNGTDYTPAF